MKGDIEKAGEMLREDFPDSKPVAGVGTERLRLSGTGKSPGDVAEGPRLPVSVGGFGVEAERPRLPKLAEAVAEGPQLPVSAGGFGVEAEWLRLPKPAGVVAERPRLPAAEAEERELERETREDIMTADVVEQRLKV